jgi:hypothetical protein
MKKAVVASLLAFSVASIAPGARVAFSQTQVNLGSNAQASGGVSMSPAEYAAYNNAIGQTTPQTKAPALEAYLTAYPQSAVKADTLQQLMLAYSSFDPAKTLDAADRLLQVDPNNLRALTFEVYFRMSGADQIADATAKQAALDKAADFAQKGLTATKPKDMTDADFNFRTEQEGRCDRDYGLQVGSGERTCGSDDETWPAAAGYLHPGFCLLPGNYSGLRELHLVCIACRGVRSGAV